MKWILEALLLVALFALFSFYFAIRPFRINSDITPKKYNLNYEELSFTTQDGITLRGWWIPAAKKTDKAIILLHGYPADKGNIFPNMRFLQQEYNLLLFDFRYFGQSGGHYTTIGKDEVLDVLAAVQVLKEKQMRKIGVWGFSMGAAVALMSAAESRDINMVIADSGYARLDWMAEEHFKVPVVNRILATLMRAWGIILLQYDITHISPANALAKLTIPVLLISSDHDDLIAARHAKLLQEIAASKPNVKVITYQHLSHGEFASDYEKVIVDFVAAALQD